MRYLVYGLAVCVTVLAVAMPGYAKEDAKDPQLEQCITAADMNDPAIRECYAEQNVREDERLNRNWKKLMQTVGSETKIRTALLKEQRAWIAYKDVACRHYGYGGTMDAIFANMCLGDIISQRADEIHELNDYYIKQ